MITVSALDVVWTSLNSITILHVLILDLERKKKKWRYYFFVNFIIAHFTSLHYIHLENPTVHTKYKPFRILNTHKISHIFIQNTLSLYKYTYINKIFYYDTCKYSNIFMVRLYVTFYRVDL